MKASRQTFLSKPFVFTPADAKKLNDVLSVHLRAPSFEVECSDGLSREFSDLDSLLAIENPPSREINSIRITASTEDRKDRVSIHLNRSSQSNIFIALEGNEDLMVKLNQAFEDRLSAMTPWYSTFAVRNFTNIAFALFLILYFLFLAAIALGFIPYSDTPSPSTPRSTSMGYLIAFGIVGMIVFSGWLLNKFRDRIFPMGTFAIGQGEQRYRTLEMWRWTAVIGFIVSLLAGIVLTLFS